MTWDVTDTVTDSLAESYIQATSSTAGAAAEGAADRKELEYTHTFIPLAFETLGPINAKGSAFLIQLGRRLSACTGHMRETSFLFQRLSLTINSVLMLFASTAAFVPVALISTLNHS